MAATDKLDAYGQRVAVIDPKDVTAFSAVPQDDDQKKLRALVERRHPEYVDRKDHWDFLEETYEGGREWFAKHIFRYIKEGDGEFKDRKDRAYRFNHTREVIDLVDKYLFRQHIARSEDAPKPVQKFWKRSTRNGLAIDDLMKQVSKKGSKLGRIAIVVDNNRPPGAISRAEEEQGGYQTYAYIVRPQQLLDYSFDDQGDLNWVLIEESYREDGNPLEEAPPVKARWRLWTRYEWVLYVEVQEGRKRKIVEADRGVHELGVVPVVIHDNIITDNEWYSPSMIDDIAYLDRAVANYLSNLDAIIQDQTFSQLAMPAQNLLPGEDNYNKMVEMSTKRVFLYDGADGGMPHYLSPDVKQAQIIVTVVQKIINEIYHTVGLAGERTKEDNSVGIDNSSGVAKAYDFDRVNSLLAAKADALQATENKIATLVALWDGEKLDKDVVSYPDDFDTRGLYDEFDIAARLILTEAPDEVRREQMKQVMAKLFPQAPEAQIKKMEAELKNWPPEPELEAPGATNAPKAKSDSRQGQVTKKTPA